MAALKSGIGLSLSPEQRVSGLVTASIAGFRIRLVVLPKLWRPAALAVDWRVDWVGRSLDLVGFEGDRVCVYLDGDEAAKRSLIQDVLVRIGGSGDGADRLLALDVPRMAGLTSRPPAVMASRSCSLLALALFVNPRLLESACEVADCDGELARWMEPIIHAQFVSEVRSKLTMFRRGYIESTENSSSPRGRIDLASAALADAIGDPRIKFSHDDFRMDTPLLRAVRSALQCIAAAPKPSFSALIGKWLTNRQEAQRLIDKISFAVAVHPAEALQMLRRPMPSAGHASMATLRRLAMVILTRSTSIGDTNGESTGVFSAQDGLNSFSKIEIPTWQVWQELVLKSLRRYGTAVPGRCSGPWLGMGRGSIPDVLFQRTGPGSNAQAVILDAKYKYPVDAPSVADAYQLFAYSHLFDPGSASFEVVGLVYPLPAPDSTANAYRRSQVRTVSSDMQLILVRVPWPTEVDLLRSEEYLARLGESIVRALDSVGVSGGGSRSSFTPRG